MEKALWSQLEVRKQTQHAHAPAAGTIRYAHVVIHSFNPHNCIKVGPVAPFLQIWKWQQVQLTCQGHLATGGFRPRWSPLQSVLQEVPVN